MSIFISKLSLYGELPGLSDSSLLMLFAIHFLTFTFFHTAIGDKVMNKIKKSEVRIVCQETFKGYGKGLSLIQLVHKGMKLHANPLYFVMVLLIRGSASALFKAFFISLIEKKPIRTSRAKANLLFITVPTIILYFVKLILRAYIHSLDSRKEEEGFEMGHLMVAYLLGRKVEQGIVHFFITFMVICKCMRALSSVITSMTSHSKPKKSLKRSKSVIFHQIEPTSTLRTRDLLA